MNLSVDMAYGTKPSRFLLPLAHFRLYASPNLSSDEKQKIVDSKQTNCIIGRLALVDDLSLFPSSIVLSQDSTASDQPFPLQFSVLGVLGIAAVTCFTF